MKNSFNLNDRVKVKIADGVEMCGKIIRVEKTEEEPYVCSILFQNGFLEDYLSSRISPITDPMDCLMVGDMLELSNGDRKKVLGICGEIYLLSTYDDVLICGSTNYTIKEIKESGFSFCQTQSVEIQQAIDLLKKEGYEIKK